MAECFLARFSDKRCHGRLIKAHLIDRQRLKRMGHDPDDPRAWVLSCGGLTGLEGHHGLADARKLSIPREAIPQGCEELAQELGLGWWMDKRWGPVIDNCVG